MKTLKCKNCGGMIEWRRGDGEFKYPDTHLDSPLLTVGCPHCRQNIVYALRNIDEYFVDEPANDDIHQPKHYTYGKIEVIDFIEQVVKDYPPERSYSIGNALKYISRAPHKGNVEEDLDKAINYLVRARHGHWKE